ncbi:MAG: GNAT family N-acetyltransferase [Pirellulaceae bacterium]|nr:GNAT family N-acetyltransferase [Pirellulaceae bacterium]
MDSGTVNCRPSAEADAEFLYQVYASTRFEELAPVPWTNPQKEQFLRQQFHAQDRHYKQHFPRASYLVVELNEKPIGRLYVDRTDNLLRIIDIALLPESRGQGIGGALVRQLLDEARASGKPVQIHVEANNPALRLYERLGFARVEDVGVYYRLVWDASRVPSSE